MTKHAKFHRIWHGKFDKCQSLKICSSENRRCSASVNRRRGVSKFQFANEETKRPRKHTQSTALQTPEGRSTDAQRFNLFGKRVIMEENQAHIDIAGLMSGVYILTVRHNGNIYTNKIIIE